MPRLKTRVPKLSRHARGGAFVTIDGRRVWLGRYGDPTTTEKYDRLMAEWLANGRENRPFAGALVPIERYRKDKRVFSVMVELNRGLYLDGDSGHKSEGFQATLNHNHLAVADIIEAFVEKAHSA